MTVRDLINHLLNYDVEEEIEFYIGTELISPIDYGIYKELPYIEFQFEEDD